eukprot:TRINITY_DN14163_c0_g1_i1.p1 TRINITY_DN14163_c0_g1~~TRINITY_DN14163_c0_g1_i1.p1  ORF type:complete len:245 (+),score=27.39 TRINITY_DN14163_c0_g1_i1:22-735(+)
MSDCRVCVECGHRVDALYRVFSARNIQLLPCAHCKKIVDPFVEFDHIVVALDALRLRLPVYRHILWNIQATVASYTKILVAIIFFSTYARLFSFSPEEPFKDVLHNLFAFAATLIELLAYTAGCFIASSILLFTSSTNFKLTFLKHVEATIVASASSILFVTILIWSYEPNFVALLRLLLLASHIVSTLALVERRGGNILVACMVVACGALVRGCIRWVLTGTPPPTSLPLILSLFG